MSKSLEHRLNSAITKEKSQEIQELINEAVHLSIYNNTEFELFQDQIKQSRIHDAQYDKDMNNFLLDQYNSLKKQGITEYESKRHAFYEAYMLHFVNMAERDSDKRAELRGGKDIA